MLCAKNRAKKNQIFEKWDKFENRPSCKGYSLCKMVNLGQKLKIPKTCKKPFYKNIKVVLWNKQLKKNTKYSRNERSLQIGHLAKAIAHAKALAFAKWLVLLKNLKCQKTCEKPFYNNIKVVLCKKPLEKTSNIREVRQVWKSAILQRL